MASSLPKKREDQLASEEIVRAQDVVLRQEHKAGEKLFARWLACRYGDRARMSTNEHQEQAAECAVRR